VPSLVVSPPDPTGAPVLFLHGGGYLSGSAYGYRHLAGALALVARRPVVVLDYRLAPEHPFPAALEDARRGFDWLCTDSHPDDLAVAADSSGAGLAMSLLLSLRDDEHPLPGRAVLMCPFVDLTGGSQVERDPHAPPIVTPDDAAHFAGLYLGDHPGDDPLVSPLNADLAGLPPLLVQAGTGDSLMPEARLLVQRAAAAGVTVELELYPVGTHDFHLFWSFLPEAADAIHRAGAFLTAADSNAARVAG
jgi:acetyl esterase/lipase